ncbi:MAG: NAD(P)H-binding protein [Betaproteobacteria bacterium]|nr:NAD(P)H-binding protein [Betaproteobacteria bacterium]MBI2292547.1 NAD(P)H-binding protein [Betaproteobacteria bacterium]MBI3053894.1 NAD(P)H-binding protein [Betaproteobacteria bacterium]
MRRLLIIGCGDIALRAAPQLRDRYRVYALTRSRERVPLLRAHGIVPITGDLDDAASLEALAGIAHDVLHCAPPPRRGTRDTRTAHLIAALAKGESLPQQLVYISTSGVYGDCEGEFVDETRAPRPQTARAQRRVDAERQLREWGRRCGVRVAILRAPGIYSEARLPLARLQAGTPALCAEEDAYTNHIHAADLARAAVAALRFAPSGRAYNAADDSLLKMGDYFDLVADRFGLPRPRRISRAEARQRIGPDLLSFMNESRRLSNRRIKRELRLKLRYPTVHEGIAAALPPPRV